jgi:hypothetical protein
MMDQWVVSRVVNDEVLFGSLDFIKYMVLIWLWIRETSLGK